MHVMPSYYINENYKNYLISYYYLGKYNNHRGVFSEDIGEFLEEWDKNNKCIKINHIYNKKNINQELYIK
jgi:hypothetical protein